MRALHCPHPRPLSRPTFGRCPEREILVPRPRPSPAPPLSPAPVLPSTGGVVLLAEHLHVIRPRAGFRYRIRFRPNETGRTSVRRYRSPGRTSRTSRRTAWPRRNGPVRGQRSQTQADGHFEDDDAQADHVQQRNTSWRAQRSASSACSRLGLDRNCGFQGHCGRRARSRGS